jgi:hypothetical protein
VATATPSHPAYVEREPRRSRLGTIAAWVGIVAGTVFVVAVIFFTGFILGAHAGGGHHHGHHGGGDREFSMHHRGGPAGGFNRQGPGGPGAPGGPGGPGAPGGPGGPGAQQPQGPQPPSPNTSAPARP